MIALNRTWEIVKLAIKLLVAWFIIHLLVITIDGLRDSGQSADAALILGNTVYPDGSLSPRLQSRVDKGWELYQTNRVKKLVVSGGLGREGKYEAEAMKQYLTFNGIPEKDVIVDNTGDNTYLSAKNYQRIHLQNNFRSVIVVTQFYHVTRSVFILRKMGIEKVGAVHADYFELRDMYSLIREFFAFYRYLLL